MDRSFRICFVQPGAVTTLCLFPARATANTEPVVDFLNPLVSQLTFDRHVVYRLCFGEKILKPEPERDGRPEPGNKVRHDRHIFRL